MSYLSGRYETNSMGGVLDFLNPKNWDSTQTALVASVLPSAGVLVAAQNTYRQQMAAAKQSGVQLTSKVAQAQGCLLQLGLFPGPITGVFDPNTQQALDTFRMKVGLGTDQRGVVTDSDLSALQQAATAAAAQAGIPSSALQPPVAAPGFLASLPSWALPVGAVGALLLVRQMMK